MQKEQRKRQQIGETTRLRLLEAQLLNSKSPGFRLMRCLEIIQVAVLVGGGLAFLCIPGVPEWVSWLWLIWVFAIGPGLAFALNLKRLQSQCFRRYLSDPGRDDS